MGCFINGGMLDQRHQKRQEKATSVIRSLLNSQFDVQIRASVIGCGKWMKRLEEPNLCSSDVGTMTCLPFLVINAR